MHDYEKLVPKLDERKQCYLQLIKQFEKIYETTAECDGDQLELLNNVNEIVSKKKHEAQLFVLKLVSIILFSLIFIIKLLHNLRYFYSK